MHVFDLHRRLIAEYASYVSGFIHFRDERVAEHVRTSLYHGILSPEPLTYLNPPFEPAETFRVLKNNEMKKYGEYRTRRLVLEAWDRLGLAPRNRDGRYDAGAPVEPHGGPRPAAAGKR
jgi:hypothetical protein